MNIEKYIGIDYKHSESSFEYCDCWGFVRLFYREEFDIELKTTSYEEKWWKSPTEDVYTTLIELNDGFLLDNDPDNWELGDVMVFNIMSDNGKANHAGLWVPERERVLHVQEGCLSIATPLNRNLYPRLKGVYRHASRL